MVTRIRTSDVTTRRHQKPGGRRTRKRGRPRPKSPPASGGLDRRRGEASRLLWRAGFGPRPGDVERLARMTREAAVYSLTRPRGAARLVGPEPRITDGSALAPFDRDGHDHLWWFDRMVRSTQPLVERLTLIFHDWFATSNDKVDNQRQMINQNQLLRRHALGSFGVLFKEITIDPAMLIWLDGTSNAVGNANENYAREMMELFSLGADRGAYTERDIREQARALTGWVNDNADQLGNYNFRYDPSLHDSSPKRIFGRTGNFGWEAAVGLCLLHPLHPSFFVTKLWSYFMPSAPDATTIGRLARLYAASGYSIRPVVEAILLDDRLYSGPAMVKPPVVYAAGLLRALGRPVDTENWLDSATQTGQRLFRPPNVSGWPKDRWLDTSTFKGRWDAVALALTPSAANPDRPPRYRTRGETHAEAVAAALAALGNPPLSSATASHLSWVARQLVGGGSGKTGPPARLRAMRRNALRQLILSSPDYNTC
jgi:hypothetical protein